MTDHPDAHTWTFVTRDGREICCTWNGQIETVAVVEYDEPQEPLYRFRMDEEKEAHGV